MTGPGGEAAVRQGLERLQELAGGEVAAYVQAAEELLARAAAHGEGSELHLLVLNEYGNACRSSARYAEALEVFDTVIRRAESLPEPAGTRVRALAHLNAAIVHDVIDSLPDGLGHMLKADSLFSSLGDEQGLARTGLVRAAFHLRTDDLEKAHDCYLQALAYWTETGQHERAVSVKSNLAVVYRILGQLDEAIDYGRAAATEATSLLLRATSLSNLALACAAAGRHAEVDEVLAESERQLERLGDPNYTAEYYRIKALIRHDQGRSEEALELLGRLLSLDGEAVRLRSTVQAYALLTSVHEALGNPLEALRSFRRYHELVTEQNREKAAVQFEMQRWRSELEQAREQAERERQRQEQLTESLTLLRSEHEKISAHARQLEIHSYRDALTDLANRRYFDERLAELAVEPALADGGGLLMIDLDDFKAINDSHGHLRGDDVLREVARLLERCVPRAGLCARLGGEEFAVLTTGHGCMEELSALADRICQAVENHAWARLVPGLRVTASIGGAWLKETQSDPLGLLSLADRRLYAAKQAGRNRAVVSG